METSPISSLTKICHSHILNHHIHRPVGEFPSSSSQSGLQQGQAAAWSPPGPLTMLSPDSGARGKGLRPDPALAEPGHSRPQRRSRGEAGCWLELHPSPSSCFLNRFVSKALPGRLPLERKHSLSPPPSWGGSRGEAAAILGRSGRRGINCLRGEAAAPSRGDRPGPASGETVTVWPGLAGSGLGWGHSPAPAAADTPPPAIPSG